VPQLTRGARQALDSVNACAGDIRAELAEASNVAKDDPDETRARITLALRALDDLMRAVDRQIAPLLERHAPQYEQRLSDLERRIEVLESGGTVVPLRRKAEG
jgi:hypothetical protein